MDLPVLCRPPVPWPDAPLSARAALPLWAAAQPQEHLRQLHLRQLHRLRPQEHRQPEEPHSDLHHIMGLHRHSLACHSDHGDLGEPLPLRVERIPHTVKLTNQEGFHRLTNNAEEILCSKQHEILYSRQQERLFKATRNAMFKATSRPVFWWSMRTVNVDRWTPLATVHENVSNARPHSRRVGGRSETLKMA